MDELTASASHMKLCDFLEGNGLAALEITLVDFLNLTENFDKFPSVRDYILAHKAVVDRLASLGHSWTDRVYGLLFIRAAATSYPQWATNRRYYYNVPSEETPALGTLYMTLRTETRLAEIAVSAPAAPIS
ncbi:hypothetical protein K3495_g12988 [Podosphaera aphanis]|nr:hypothetical protein K3495_g12988 [Podosphaera aphanis]